MFKNKTQYEIMVGFIRKIFIELLSASTIRSFHLSLDSNSEGRIKFVSLNNRPCQARPILANINCNEPFYDPFTVSVNKCGGSCKAMMIHMLRYFFQIK